MYGKALSILVILLVVFVGGWYTLNGARTLRHGAPPSPEDTAAAAVVIPTTTTTVTGVTVAYTDKGFSPEKVTVEKGESVTWIDERTNPMQIASSPYPNAAAYDGTATSTHCAADYAGPAPFDQCSPGTAYSFIFDKAGTWTYQDATDAGMTGTVVVKP